MNAVLSPIMDALYHGRTDEAHRLADDAPPDSLTVHEAAAVGRLPRLEQLLAADPALGQRLVARRIPATWAGRLLWPAPGRRAAPGTRWRGQYARPPPVPRGRPRTPPSPDPIMRSPACWSPRVQMSMPASRAASPRCTRPLRTASSSSSDSCSSMAPMPPPPTTSTAPPSTSPANRAITGVVEFLQAHTPGT